MSALAFAQYGGGGGMGSTGTGTSTGRSYGSSGPAIGAGVGAAAGIGCQTEELDEPAGCALAAKSQSRLHAGPRGASGPLPEFYELLTLPGGNVPLGMLF